MNSDDIAKKNRGILSDRNEDSNLNRLARGTFGADVPRPPGYVSPPPQSGQRALRTPAEIAADGIQHLLFTRPDVNGLYFNGKLVRLEGYRFVSCRFDNCQIEIVSSNFELIDCVLDPSCKLRYGGDVINVIKLFNSKIGDWIYETMPEFAPTRNEDGSITIKSKRS